MFPVEFDRHILSSLPLPGEEQIKVVAQTLRAVLLRRVLPHFKTRRGTDPLLLARVGEQLAFARLEDETNRVRTVSLVDIRPDRWSVHIHERIFDYLAFVIRGDTELHLGDGTVEERKMLAFMEFLLRHEVEHVLYPDHREREVITADVEFALDRRTHDPTTYRMLLGSLSDEMVGIRGERYLALFEEGEQGRAPDAVIIELLNLLGLALSELPAALLDELFPGLDTEIESRILLECYRRSRDASIPLIHRLFSFERFLRLFADLIEHQDKTAREVFQTFKDRWGLEAVFQELGVVEEGVHNKGGEEQFALFRAALEAAGVESRAVVLPSAPSLPSQVERRPVERPEKTLRDRIEEAREDPRIPRQVMDVIDKNKLNLIGHSGSKYSELIETLLAIPWGEIVEIGVTAAAFEEGLNQTHFGLQRPKEILCDFFTNLIWRYRHFEKSRLSAWKGNGSAFLLVGPPGVGKTSLAISVARNLGIPYHKLSLGGMRDETDIRGHGFTYEGSKPGAIVQGLIKMGAMNGLFVLDEADKTEKFAIATLLEILDPEQNHLFHDKYTETTVDIDLSNCHFFLTANTLETVPPVVVNRCEVVVLDRYSVEEKIAIAQDYLIRRVRGKYQIEPRDVYFDPEQEPALIRYLIQNYTYEAGVRELERVIRTLFLRIQRKELLIRKEPLGGGVRITREKIKATLKEPTRPRQISDADRIGEMLGLGVDVERGVGSIIPIQATSISAGRPAGEVRRGPLSIVHATGNIEKVMDESRKVATTGILACAADLGIDLDRLDEQVHLHFMGGSTRKDGPSAGGAIALALASLFAGRIIRRDVAMTGEIDIKGRITGVGGLAAKLETACNAGCSTVIIPRDNLVGDEGVERFPDALKRELHILSYEEWLGPHDPFDYQRHILQVVAVDHIVQAARIAFVNEEELAALETIFVDDAKKAAEELIREGTENRPFLQLVQVKSVDELVPPLPGCSLCESGVGVTLLIRPELRETLSILCVGAKQPPQMRDFDPNRETLSEVLQELLALCGATEAPMPRLSLVAPFYFLKRDGIGPGAFPDGVCHEGIKIFANNYTLQGVKIKGCKSALNHAYGWLARLRPETLAACPFLGRRNGVYVADLSFIPEQYRLDIQRAEKILNRCLHRWMETVHERLRSERV